MTTVIEKCGRLRFVVPDETSVERPRLQQEFQVVEYEDGGAVRETREWRDVPVVAVKSHTRRAVG